MLLYSFKYLVRVVMNILLKVSTTEMVVPLKQIYGFPGPASRGTETGLFKR